MNTDEYIKKRGPIDQVRFNGNRKPLFGDLNKVFIKDKIYDLYHFEGQDLAFGEDGKSYKVTGDVIWTKISEEKLDTVWEELWLAIGDVITKCDQKDIRIIHLQTAAQQYVDLQKD